VGADSSEVAEQRADPAGYDRLLNIAASAVTVAAGVLGVFGIGTGVATALLRNAPEATLTCACVAGVAVLAGLASALVRTDTAIRRSPLSLKVGIVGAALLAATMWVLIGGIYRRDGARTEFNAWAWYFFIGGIVIVTTAAICLVTFRSPLRLRTGLALGAVLLFGSAMLATVVLATATLRTTAQPTVEIAMSMSADPAGYVTVTGKVTSAGLAGDEKYEVVAFLLSDRASTDETDDVFRGYAGADSSGTVSYAFSLSFAPRPELLWLGVRARLLGDGRQSERSSDRTLLLVPPASATAPGQTR